MNLPEELLQNPHFARYYHTWQKNRLSVVFIPLAQICREQGLLSQALEICESGLVHHPNSISGRLLLARIYFDLDQLEDARRLVDEILREMPAQREAQALRDQMKRLGAPLQEKEVPGKKPPRSLWENVTMARIYADQGEVKVALEIIERILQRDPQDARALRLREELTPCKS